MSPVATQSKLTVGGNKVLVDGDLIGAPVSGCRDRPRPQYLDGSVLERYDGPGRRFAKAENQRQGSVARRSLRQDQRHGGWSCKLSSLVGPECGSNEAEGGLDARKAQSSLLCFGRSLRVTDGDLVFEQGDLAIIAGRDNFLQAMQMMIETPFGTDIFNVNYGFDLLSILRSPQTVRLARS